MPKETNASITTSHPDVEMNQIGLDSRNLLRAVYRSECPEELIKELPVQSLYMALQHEGIESSVDILAVITKEQYVHVLDFELWNKDEFVEERFWKWLAAIDDPNSIKPLERFENCIDTSLMMLIVRRYVSTTTFEDQEASPPGVGYYTPDQGYTWLAVMVEDEHRRVLLSKLLALIFQQSPERFYQLIAEASSRSSLELMEEAYEEAFRRLADIGIPDFDTAMRINSPLMGVVDSSRDSSGVLSTGVVSLGEVPLVLYEGEMPEAVDSLINDLARSGGVEAVAEFELQAALIANAAAVFYEVSFGEYNEVLILLNNVKSVLGIGLELAEEMGQGPRLAVYKCHGAEVVYRMGLGQLKQLQKQASKCYQICCETPSYDAEILEILDSLMAPLPEIPKFYAESGYLSGEDGKLLRGRRSIKNLRELRAISKFLTELEDLNESQRD